MYRFIRKSIYRQTDTFINRFIKLFKVKCSILRNIQNTVNWDNSVSSIADGF